jgi:hypothetical protein
MICIDKLRPILLLFAWGYVGGGGDDDDDDDDGHIAVGLESGWVERAVGSELVGLNRKG